MQIYEQRMLQNEWGGAILGEQKANTTGVPHVRFPVFDPMPPSHS